MYIRPDKLVSQENDGGCNMYQKGIHELYIGIELLTTNTTTLRVWKQSCNTASCSNLYEWVSLTYGIVMRDLWCSWGWKTNSDKPKVVMQLASLACHPLPVCCTRKGLVKCPYQSRPFLQNLEENTLLCIAYGEGVVLILDVVCANKFLQDEIGIGTSPDPSVRSKLVRGGTPDY